MLRLINNYPGAWIGPNWHSDIHLGTWRIVGKVLFLEMTPIARK